MTSYTNAQEQFQSTLPRRERLHLSAVTADKSCFNPRSREGSDVLIVVCFFYFQCFNPRSREGSDVDESMYIAYSRCFNPRSREGSDSLRKKFKSAVKVSIHAPAKGATIIKS